MAGEKENPQFATKVAAYSGTFAQPYSTSYPVLGASLLL